MHCTIVAPTRPLPPCKLTVQDVETLLPAMEGYLEQFASAFARIDQHAPALRSSLASRLWP